MQRSPLRGREATVYIDRVINQRWSSTMTFLRGLSSISRSLVGAALVNLSVTMPALAAPTFSLPFDITAFGTREWLLYGSIALLVISLAAKVIRDHYHSEPPPQGPDLRWWKNPPADLQP